MVAALPRSFFTLEEALKKVSKREPLTRVERALVQQTLDAIPPASEPGDDLRRATERLRALGVDDEVVFSGSAEEVMAFLDATEPGACASST